MSNAFWAPNNTPAQFFRMGQRDRMLAGLRGFGIGRLGIVASRAGAVSTTTMRASDATALALPSLVTAPTAAPASGMTAVRQMTPLATTSQNADATRVVSSSLSPTAFGPPRMAPALPSTIAVQTSDGSTVNQATGPTYAQGVPGVPEGFDPNSTGGGGSAGEDPGAYSTEGGPMTPPPSAAAAAAAQAQAIAQAQAQSGVMGMLSNIPTWVKVVGGIGIGAVVLHKLSK